MNCLFIDGIYLHAHVIAAMILNYLFRIKVIGIRLNSFKKKSFTF